MKPFEMSFTLCAWIRRLHNARQPVVLHYHSGEIVVGDNGHYNYVGYQNLDLRDKFPAANTWFHYGLSWKYGGSQRVYINGVEIGSQSAEDGWPLRLGGEIALGNQVGYKGWKDHIFRGQLYKLNMFSEQLSSSQIREMAEAGLCSAVEEKYESRQLRWEDLLTKQKYGNVTEFLPTECYDDIKYLK
jgi:hypothetical protein